MKERDKKNERNDIEKGEIVRKRQNEERDDKNG